MSTTLYVSNLPFSTTKEALAGKFGNVGTAVCVKLDRSAGVGVHVYHPGAL